MSLQELFNCCRAAMMEFEINMSEMPLEKLSKSFEALTEIHNLLNSNVHNASYKESLIVDASNLFFTVIPSIHPHVIRDENDFKSKTGFDVHNKESLDEKYKKLRSDIAPLPHDSNDYRLIENYLQTTHAPTHTDWALELEAVFSLDRDGEFDKFVPYQEKPWEQNARGSHLTNFVGILSQGLRIAPPDAPATGYMLGKGVYFADPVSKSTQYCFTDRNNPVGLMLLSEVALGEIYELKKATESEYVKWKDEVVVPCDRPVTSNLMASELMYNEYIVYNTAQNIQHKPSTTANSPFVASIWDKPLPPKFKMPTIDSFDGATDPVKHLETYRTLMILHAFSDEIMCWAFPVTLKGSARLWFSQLPVDSVSTFQHLSDSFLSHFIRAQRQRCPATQLLNICQTEGESLRSFVTRFNTEALQVAKNDDKVILTAFMAGLRSSDFLFSLSKNPPISMATLLFKAQKYMNAEDSLAARQDPTAKNPTPREK
ncbi:hypothetical protein HYC85_031357 [Camellia sinensis]|uniref:Poly [ADP-ribose] polymerase n=1 Tax=Camellia sinensis TaxID=4442 RepID=A0A7J7FU97_CAMSI|nr:hypothetical protein HYC85_031357 [Camellia sinensis]